ncbi:butyryl-CoA dehydrogenase [Solimonas aquatica]|uniref:Butyryl-CoA dehydrogenase n=1 Tax=Solimonas aquatica TaxID=489703 RepID=A0A1H9M203_9GAMM|nr:acyl-CoA dehydrogenase [Solimonas aquatica]SER17644.1 butyryl-CoA dehydrogenase [Solimonas aquatica]
MNHLSNLQFLLFDWLQVEKLADRARFADLDRASITAVLENCERIAAREFAPHNRQVDVEEPQFDGERVQLPAVTAQAVRAYIESGMLAASQDAALGGLQLPRVAELAGNSFFAMASIAMFAYPMLTVGNANLLLAHGTAKQKDVFARAELEGRWFGTMCLSEPQAGSSLSDVATRAQPDGEDGEQDPLGPRYRLRGNKMWISAGEHELSENIVHLVLAKVPDAQGRLPAGVKGLSLFIVPKYLVTAEGVRTSERNDVALAGLNHKLGYRGTTNTLLNFGEGRYRPRGSEGAIGYRVGAEGEGLKCMFHMMNEARVGVGMGAAMLGMAGYQASLDYAQQRRQGRPLQSGGKDVGAQQVPIIQHADIKRMLLAQKAYCEGALALLLYCAQLIDRQHSGNAEEAQRVGLLLEMLTPVAKSWPSQWCLEANSLAIQVHGGYGYTRDFPVEQHWRDNRLNMIHEGTHGIQGLDLLGRKVTMAKGQGLRLLSVEMEATIRKAGGRGQLREEAADLSAALQQLLSVTQSAWAGGRPEETLANATLYLQGFGHLVLAWIWLDVALSALAQADETMREGKLAACRYFFRYELPKIEAWLQPVARRDDTCLQVHEAHL